MSQKVYGTIFNIQRFSIHDGPGIRTVVFEKGCPLKCRWCANPESQLPNTQIAWTREKCIGCQGCVNSGLQSGFLFQEGKLYWDRLEPTEVKNIERICPSQALHTIGYQVTPQEVLEKVDRDEIFYSNLDGGLTISGGEPLMQADFTYELLSLAQAEGINTAIETTGHAPYEVFHKIATKLDYLLMDVKVMDDEIHRKNTGVSNQLILSNLVRIREDFPKLPILIRTPVIPGVNDSEEAIEAIYQTIFPFDNVKYELLKYHRLGEPKYESLHRRYPMGEKTLDEELFETLKKKFQFDHINKEQLYTDGGGI